MNTIKITLKWNNNGGVRLYANGAKTKAYAGGAGYDKRGTVLAEYLKEELSEEIIASINNGQKYIDGAKGFTHVEMMIEKLGGNVEYIKETKTIEEFFLNLPWNDEIIANITKKYGYNGNITEVVNRAPEAFL